MYAIMTQNSFKRVGLPLFSFASLLLCVLAQPSLSFPLALLLPLIICPAQVTTGLWFSLLLPLLPCAGLLYAGGDFLIALSTLPFSYLSLIVSQVAHKRKLDFSSTTLWYTAAILCSFAFLGIRLTQLLGGDLFHGLASYLTDSIARLPTANATLYSLVQTGFLELPSQVTKAASFLLGQNILLVPQVRTELLNALRFQLFSILRQGMPSLLIQLSLILGLFTALQTKRENARQHPKPVLVIYQNGTGEITSTASVLPSFRALFLPAAYQRHTLLLAIAALLLLCYGRGEVASLTSSMMMTAVTTIYSLLGAAVVVFMLCQRHPKRTAIAGIAAGTLFIVFPTVLLALGLCDQFLHLRVPNSNHHEED